MPEELRLGQPADQIRAVKLDQRTTGRRSHPMQRLGDEFLTGTRFAQDQHSAFVKGASRAIAVATICSAGELPMRPGICGKLIKDLSSRQSDIGVGAEPLWRSIGKGRGSSLPRVCTETSVPYPYRSCDELLLDVVN